VDCSFFEHNEEGLDNLCVNMLYLTRETIKLKRRKKMSKKKNVKTNPKVVQQQEVEIVRGNTDVLMVKLLNEMNNNLIAIRKLLAE